MPDPMPPLDRDTLAAEMALGILDHAERADALRLCLSDPDFAAAVQQWGLRFSPLLANLHSVEAPAHIWPMVAARVGSGDHDSQHIRTLRRWRGIAAICGAIAATLGLFILVRPADAPAPTAMGVAQLADASGAGALAIAYDPSRGTLRLSRAMLGDSQKRPELWVIPSDGKPRSLGLINGGSGTLTIDRSLQPFLAEGVTLAITLEDPSTAPHPAPTSAPILTGKISII
ncbi:Anti-sigma-K factor RskA [Sphingobium sp. AP50]|nr:Anti-sigma-K factor RskA [Sphingobium sp. AP50]